MAPYPEQDLMEGLSAGHARVTGGGRGIGRAIAAALTDAGARVTVAGGTEGPLQETVKSGDAAGFFTVDVVDPAALRDGIASGVAERGPVDILIANAGRAESAPFAEGGADMLRRLIDLNLMGTVNAMHAVIGWHCGAPLRGYRRPRLHGQPQGYAYVSTYCAAKHAVVGLVRSLALDIAKSGGSQQVRPSPTASPRPNSGFVAKQVKPVFGGD